MRKVVDSAFFSAQHSTAQWFQVEHTHLVLVGEGRQNDVLDWQAQLSNQAETFPAEAPQKHLRAIGF